MQAHKARVRSMMQGFGQATPDKLTVPNVEVRKRMCRLIIEEVLELVEASGLLILVSTTQNKVNYELVECPVVDFVEMVDAMVDISVVLHGATNGCGISDRTWEMLCEEVDNNNLLKIQNGHLDSETGKFIKPIDHPKPNIVDILFAQDDAVFME